MCVALYAVRHIYSVKFKGVVRFNCCVFECISNTFLSKFEMEK